MTRTTPTNTTPAGSGANGQPPHPHGQRPDEAVDPVERLQALKQALRGALTEVNTVIRALKRHHRRTKALESTLASLRQLEEAGR